jgi:hypothetical protein
MENVIKRDSGLLVRGNSPRRRPIWTPLGVRYPYGDGFTFTPKIAGGAARTFAAWNGTQATTGALTKVTTGTAVKTLMQIQTNATAPGIRVIEWGISFDAVAGVPIECELIDTVSVAATVTTYASTDIVYMNNPSAEVSTIVRGTTASGFTATAEGTITAGRTGDYQLVSQQYVKQFPLGREFEVPISHNLRVRVTAGTAVNAIAYVVWEE